LAKHSLPSRLFLLGVFHGQALPPSRRYLAPEFFLRAIARRQNMVTSIAKPVRIKGKPGVVPAFVHPYLAS
jgi:hypothetical protein